VKMLQDVGMIYVKRKQVRAPSEALSPADGGERKKSQTVARKSQQKTSSSAATPTPAQASDQGQDPIEKVLQHLSSVKQKLSNRARFMIMDLEDLRKNNWQPRREKQGPKTMEEVKNDLLEEAAENQAERDAYDRRAAAARSDYMGRKSSRQNVSGYQGRGSSDNRAQQQSLPYDKRAAAAQASTQATSLSSMAMKKEMSSLRMADQTTKLGGSKGSYFARKARCLWAVACTRNEQLPRLHWDRWHLLLLQHTNHPPPRLWPQWKRASLAEIGRRVGRHHGEKQTADLPHLLLWARAKQRGRSDAHDRGRLKIIG